MNKGEPVWIFVSPQGGFVHQTSNREVRHQETVELLLDQLRRLAAQHNLRPAQMGFQFVQRRLSGKGLARRRDVSFRFQPLPLRTAREVFPQAAHPVNFVERVMRLVG
jgi:hypothetical protein